MSAARLSRPTHEEITVLVRGLAKARGLGVVEWGPNQLGIVGVRGKQGNFALDLCRVLRLTVELGRLPTAAEVVGASS